LGLLTNHFTVPSPNLLEPDSVLFGVRLEVQTFLFDEEHWGQLTYIASMGWGRGSGVKVNNT
jgi:hypothetical protein